MTHLIDKDALVADIERRKNLCEKITLDLRNQENKDYYQGKAEAYKETIDLLDTLEVIEVDLENYNKVKKVLSISFMHFLDANRPEGKMCLSNGECFDIEKAFDELDFAKLFRYMEKQLKAQKGEEQ